MTTALICLDGYRVAAVLDAARATLAADATWLLLHVSDTRPDEGFGHALDRLPGRGAARDRAREKVRHVVEWSEEEVRAEAAAWLKATGLAAELLVVRGRPEREIVAVAADRRADLVVLGGGRGLPGRYPGPGPFPLSPVARYVVDHAPTDVLLLRRYVAAADRRA